MRLKKVFLLVLFLVLAVPFVSSDEFAKLFEKNGECITIDESSVLFESPGFGYIFVDENFDIFVPDSTAKNVKRYDKHGKLKSVYGGPGSGPGEFIFPHTVVIRDKLAIVKDLTRKECATFDKETSKFTANIDLPYSCHHLKINPFGQIFCGNLLVTGKNKKYRFNNKFEVDGRFFDISLLTDIIIKRQPWLPMDFDSKGNIYVASWLSYRVAVYDKNLKLLRVFGEPGKHWNPQTTESELVVSEKKGQEQFYRYTKLVNIYALNDKYVITEKTVIGNPEAFHLDVYTTEGKKIYSDLFSNRIITGKDHLNNLYVYSYDEKGKDIQRKLCRYRLKKSLQK